MVRKSIARVLTVYQQTSRNAIKGKILEDGKNKKGKARLPLDLRAKKTRAMRKALTKEQVCGRRLIQILSLDFIRLCCTLAGARSSPRSRMTAPHSNFELHEAPALVLDADCAIAASHW